MKEFHAMNGLYRKLAAAAVVLAALGGSNRAEAALRLTLTSGGTTQQFFSAGDALVQNTTIDGYTVVLNLVLTNFSSNAGSGFGTLVTSTAVNTGAGPISPLAVLAEVVVSPTAASALAVFTSPTGPSFLQTIVAGTSTSGVAAGSSTSNGFTVSVPPVVLPGVGINTGIFNAGAGYTLQNLTVLTGVAPNMSSQGVEVRSNVTPVPEPATVAMALSVLPLMGLGLLRRRRPSA
jgi:hypothetical protein